ncbi:MAG: ACT domain-containing protein [Planctomycetota bacterium]|nr:MAG: ACT domain-containing protein [Planctomycetota bacterium]
MTRRPSANQQTRSELPMETYTQFSVFLANKPGMLSQLFRELAKAKINVTSLAMMDSVEHGVLRLIPDDPKEAREVFKRLNVPVSESQVLGVTLANRPGAAADLCERLSQAHINIGYMYCTTGAKGGKTLAVLRVPDIKKAMKVLDGSRTRGKDMKVKLRRPTPARRR